MPNNMTAWVHFTLIFVFCLDRNQTAVLLTYTVHDFLFFSCAGGSHPWFPSERLSGVHGGLGAKLQRLSAHWNEEHLTEEHLVLCRAQAGCKTSGQVSWWPSDRQAKKKLASIVIVYKTVLVQLICILMTF